MPTLSSAKIMYWVWYGFIGTIVESLLSGRGGRGWSGGIVALETLWYVVEKSQKGTIETNLRN